MDPKTPPPPRPLRQIRQSQQEHEPDRSGEESQGPELTGLNLNRAMEFSLVLWSVGIGHRVVRELDGYALEVTPAKAERAREELHLYLEENQAAAGGTDSEFEGRTHPSALLPILLIIVFYPLTNLAFPEHRIFSTTWNALGSAEAAAIFEGQWWRLATALSLHADPAHLLGNAVIGSGFLLTASRFISPGLCALMTILAGILGNLVNAAVLGPPHDAIGFSTAVFGTAGLLVGHRAAAGARRSLRAMLLPLAAGLALLSMLGIGDERTDVGAHLFGFLAGVLLGILVRLAVRRPLPARMETMLLLLPVLVMTGAWYWAFSARG